MSLTNFAEQIAMEAVYVPSATYYVGLFTTAPADDGTGGVEVSGGSYARIAATFAVTVGDPTYAENEADIVFATATANWGTVTHAGVFSAVSGGNLLDVNELVDPATPTSPMPRVIVNGDLFTITAGLLVSELS